MNEKAGFDLHSADRPVRETVREEKKTVPCGERETSHPYRYADLEDPVLPPSREMRKGWRLLIYYPVKAFLFLLFRPRVIGAQNLPGDSSPFIVAANHGSNWDPLLIIAFTGIWPDFIAKEGLFRWRPAARLLMKLGAFPVDRQMRDMKAVRRILSRLQDGRILGLFPQGTRVRGDREKLMNKPKDGYLQLAARRGLKVVPIAIQGSFRPFCRVTLHIMPPLDAREALKKEGADACSLRMMEEIYRTCGEAFPSAEDFAARNEKKSKGAAGDRRAV